MDAAAGVQRRPALVGPGDLQAPGAAVAQPLAELCAEPAEIDDGAVDAGGAQAQQVVLDQRTTADLDQRLGRAIGQRTQAFAAAGREDEGRRHGACSPSASNSRSSGLISG